MIAQIAVETGISPQDLIALDPEMIKAILQVFSDRAKEIQNASQRNRRR